MSRRLGRPAKIAVDSALLAGFVIEFVTRERSFDADYLLHGITGLALVVVVAVHLSGNRAWIAAVRAKGRAHREARLALVNLTFGAMAAVCILTGMPLWWDWTDSDVVAVAHATTGFLCAVLMIAHLVMNRRRIRSLLWARPAGVA